MDNQPAVDRYNSEERTRRFWRQKGKNPRCHDAGFSLGGRVYTIVYRNSTLVRLKQNEVKIKLRLINNPATVDKGEQSLRELRTIRV